MQASASRTVQPLRGLFPHEAMSRQDFAQFIANSSGFLAGVAVVQLGNLSALRFGRLSELFLALTVILSIFVVFHTLAHVSADREEITKAGARTAMFGVLGAALGSLPDFVLSFLPRVGWVPEFLVLGCVAVLGFATVMASSANRRFPRSSTFRTVSVSTAMLFAEVSCFLGLIAEFAALRGAVASAMRFFVP